MPIVVMKPMIIKGNEESIENKEEILDRVIDESIIDRIKQIQAGDTDVTDRNLTIYNTSQAFYNGFSRNASVAQTPRSACESDLSRLTSLGGRWYVCPVYEGRPGTAGAREPILRIPLATGPRGANYWTQRRVALYLNQS